MLDRGPSPTPKESSRGPSWASYLALMTAFHALANTETGTLRAVWFAFSILWSIPTTYYLWKALRDDR